MIQRLTVAERAQGLAEYGLVLSLASLGAILAVALFGVALLGWLTGSSADLAGHL